VTKKHGHLGLDFRLKTFRTIPSLTWRNFGAKNTWPENEPGVPYFKAFKYKMVIQGKTKGKEQERSK